MRYINLVLAICIGVSLALSFPSSKEIYKTLIATMHLIYRLFIRIKV